MPEHKDRAALPKVCRDIARDRSRWHLVRKGIPTAENKCARRGLTTDRASECLYPMSGTEVPEAVAINTPEVLVHVNDGQAMLTT